MGPWPREHVRDPPRSASPPTPPSRASVGGGGGAPVRRGNWSNLKLVKPGQRRGQRRQNDKCRRSTDLPGTGCGAEGAGTACPISTGGGMRRVRSVRGAGRAGGRAGGPGARRTARAWERPRPESGGAPRPREGEGECTVGTRVGATVGEGRAHIRDVVLHLALCAARTAPAPSACAGRGARRGGACLTGRRQRPPPGPAAARSTSF